VFWGEFEETKRSLAHKEVEMWQLVETMQRLEDTEERKNRKRRWEPKRATRNYMYYGG